MKHKHTVQKGGVTDKRSNGGSTPPRVPPRLEGVVKNVGTKEKKKSKRYT